MQPRWYILHLRFFSLYDLLFLLSFQSSWHRFPLDAAEELPLTRGRNPTREGERKAELLEYRSLLDIVTLPDPKSRWRLPVAP